MRAASRLLSRPVLLVIVLGAAACGDGEGPTTPTEDLPGQARPAAVLLDTSDNLVARPHPGDADSFTVFVPEHHRVGVIIDASGPLGVVHGRSSADVAYSFDGKPVSAIAEHTATGRLDITVQHIVPHFNNVSYHLRIIAVDPKPEHAVSSLSPGTTFHREWVDPPLDVDVYTIDFGGVDRYFVELESEDEDVRVSARVVTPSGVTHFVIVGSGAGMTRGATYPVDESGPHQLLIYAAGLKPDVQARYRFRVVRADAPATASADH